MINIKLKTHGIFKDYLNNEISIKLNDNVNIDHLKKYIKKYILIDNLTFLNSVLNKSVFSNNSEILPFDYILKPDDTIFLLPPFSGG